MRSKLSVDEALAGMEALCNDIEAQYQIAAKPHDWRTIIGRSAIAICLGYVVLDSIGWAHPIEYRLGLRPLATAQCIEMPARLQLTANRY